MSKIEREENRIQKAFISWIDSKDKPNWDKARDYNKYLAAFRAGWIGKRFHDEYVDRVLIGPPTADPMAMEEEE